VIKDEHLSDELDRNLAELETLHARETEALRAMNRAALDDITVEKETLCERLHLLRAHTEVQPRHRAALERLRRQASLNQLLLVHARDAVRTILSQATGATFEAIPHSNRKLGGQEGLRLNVRG
jgi:hypothetical protein